MIVSDGELTSLADSVSAR